MSKEKSSGHQFDPESYRKKIKFYLDGRETTLQSGDKMVIKDTDNKILFFRKVGDRIRMLKFTGLPERVGRGFFKQEGLSQEKISEILQHLFGLYAIFSQETKKLNNFCFQVNTFIFTDLKFTKTPE